MHFPERGNWKQLAAFVLQWGLSLIGAMALVNRQVSGGDIFVAFSTTFVLGIAPRFVRVRRNRHSSTGPLQ